MKLRMRWGEITIRYVFVLLHLKERLKTRVHLILLPPRNKLMDLREVDGVKKLSQEAKQQLLYSLNSNPSVCWWWIDITVLTMHAQFPKGGGRTRYDIPQMWSINNHVLYFYLHCDKEGNLLSFLKKTLKHVLCFRVPILLEELLLLMMSGSALLPHNAGI